MIDANICSHCEARVARDSPKCPGCRNPLHYDASGRIAIWRLGKVPDYVLGPLASGLGEVFGTDVIIQPARLDERLSRRTGWKGLSAPAILEQVASRSGPGVEMSLAVSSRNVVPGPGYEYVLGLAMLCEPGAVISLRQITRGVSRALLVERALKLAVHELGHNLGLGHHDHDEGARCVMVGDADSDCAEELDASTREFCRSCRRELRSRELIELRQYRARAARRGGR